MNKLIISFLFLMGCTTRISESDIQKVVEQRVYYEKICDRIGKNLKVQAVFSVSESDGMGCDLFKKGFMPIHIYEDEFRTIDRYLKLQHVYN